MFIYLLDDLARKVIHFIKMDIVRLKQMFPNLNFNADLSKIGRRIPIETKLINAVKNGAKDIVEVRIFQGKSAEVIPGKLKTMYTYGLGGCQTTFILAKGKNGNPIAIMTHFPPDSLLANINEINRLVKQNSHLIDYSIKPHAAYGLPGHYIQKDDKWVMEAKDNALLQALKLCIKSEFPQGIEEVILPYKEGKFFGQSSASVINFPNTRGELITYQACGEHSGDFGKL